MWQQLQHASVKKLMVLQHQLGRKNADEYTILCRVWTYFVQDVYGVWENAGRIGDQASKKA